MKTLSTDNNNDLYLDNTGNIAVVTDIVATMESCAHEVKTRLGECVLDTERGIPFFETVFNGVPLLMQFEAACRAAILGVAGVTEVISFVTRVIDGQLAYEATIRTIYGTGTING